MEWAQPHWSDDYQGEVQRWGCFDSVDFDVSHRFTISFSTIAISLASGLCDDHRKITRSVFRILRDELSILMFCAWTAVYRMFSCWLAIIFVCPQIKQTSWCIHLISSFPWALNIFSGIPSAVAALLLLSQNTDLHGFKRYPQ